MSFKDLALPLIARGIPVIPLAPGSKKGVLEDQFKFATTSEVHAEAFNLTNPAYNVGAVATPEGICILDCDVKGLHKRIQEETGQEFPETLIVKSAGKGCLHFYFKQTDRSRALGNRAKAETFDLQQNKKYVVGPGSILTETGKTYDIVCGAALEDFPDWLADWIDKEAPKGKKPENTEMSGVNDDFDIDGMLNFFGLEYWQNGDWYNLIGCPGKDGALHEQCKAPGFFFDGNDLGWCCWATSCDSHGKNAGWVIKHLNEIRIEDGLEPYRKLVWPDTTTELVKAEVEEAPMPETAKTAETFDEEDGPFLPVPKFKGKIVVPKTTPNPAALPAVDSATVAEPPTDTPPKMSLKYPELAFPYESLPPGRLKEMVDIAGEGGLEAGLACPAIMALASAIPFKDRMDGAKVNLYVCLLALVGAGKDTAIKRAQKVLGIYENATVYTSYAPSGERSIAMLLGDKQGGTKNAPITIPGPARHCIVTTELEDTLAKSRGETSGVLQAMQHYWDHNKKTYADAKKGIQTVDCRLSWLTALPIGDEEISTDAFRLAFGEHTSHGIVDRMFFGFAERKFDGRRSRNWDVPYEFNNFTIIEDSPMDNPAKIQIERHETLLSRLQKAEVTGFAPGVEDLYLNWAGAGRRTYDVHKLAVLVAILNGHKLIEIEDWKFTCALMDWQARIREVFNTGKAKRIHQGEMNELVIKELEKRTARIVDGLTDSNAKMIEQKNGKGEMVERPFVRWKAMANAGRWYRYGLDLEKTIEQLQKAAAIQYRETYDDEEPVDKSWIRLMGQPK